MEYKYQLIFLGSLSGDAGRLEDLFFEMVEDMNLSKDAFVIINEWNFQQYYKLLQLVVD